MKTLKKCIAFVLAAGLMLSAVTVFAADDKYVNLMETDENGNQINQGKPNFYVDYGDGDIEFTGSLIPSPDNIPDNITLGDGCSWWNNGEYLVYKNGEWVEPENFDCNTSGGSDSDGSSTKSPEDIAAIQQRAEADAVQGAAYDEGFADVGDMYRAAEKGMSAGEFYNNAVVSTPGIENAITVGQGGNLVVDGKVTNMSATISKVTNRAYLDSVRIEQEGTVLNVVDVQYPAVEATINFYTPGVLGDTEIVALQYNAGTWVEVEVAEVRDDHIVLNMKGNGVVAFIAK